MQRSTALLLAVAAAVVFIAVDLGPTLVDPPGPVHTATETAAHFAHYRQGLVDPTTVNAYADGVTVVCGSTHPATMVNARLSTMAYISVEDAALERQTLRRFMDYACPDVLAQLDLAE